MASQKWVEGSVPSRAGIAEPSTASGGQGKVRIWHVGNKGLSEKGRPDGREGAARRIPRQNTRQKPWPSSGGRARVLGLGERNLGADRRGEKKTLPPPGNPKRRGRNGAPAHARVHLGLAVRSAAAGRVPSSDRPRRPLAGKSSAELEGGRRGWVWPYASTTRAVPRSDKGCHRHRLEKVAPTRKRPA